VLAEMRFLRESRAILIAKHDELLRTRTVRGFSAVALRLYGLLYGYGYRPFRLLSWVLGVWLACGLLFQAVAGGNLIRPFDHAVFEAHRNDCGAGWTVCASLLEDYPPFHPLAYSLDLILPISGLNQTKAWAPVTMIRCRQSMAGICLAPSGRHATPWHMAYAPLGLAAATVAALERLFGWLAGLMLVSVATGLIKRT